MKYDFDKTIRYEMKCITHSAEAEQSLKSRNYPLPESSRISSEDDITTEANNSSAETIQEFIPSDSFQALQFNYNPHLDQWCKEMATLRQVQYLGLSSPAEQSHFCSLLPHMADELIYLAMGHAGLRYAYLAVGTMVGDVLRGTGMTPYYFQCKANAIRCLQESVEMGRVDEITLIEVVLHLGIDIITGNLKAAERHLQGLYLIYKHILHKYPHHLLNPTARIIIRIASKAAVDCSTLFNRLPHWPLFTAQDDLNDRQCLFSAEENGDGGLARGLSEEGKEWTLVVWELDNLNHWIYRFAKRADMYRRSMAESEAEEKIRKEYERIVEALMAWKSRDIVLRRELERSFQRAPSSLEVIDHLSGFLWYDPLPLQNNFYAKLQNQWRAASLQASLIVHPFPGPFNPHSLNRFQMAIDICRTQASLGNDGTVGPAWQALFYAGLAFGGERMYPLECGWIMEWGRRIKRDFPLIGGIVEGMPSLWSEERVAWNVYGQLVKGLTHSEQ